MGYTFNSKESYWSNNGKYQSYQEEMWKLVPSSGEVQIADNKELETAIENIRQINRIYYDFYNNGCCNLVDVEQETCPECGGSGWADEDEDDEYDEMDCSYCDGHCYVDGEAFITDYYDDFVWNLERFTNMKIKDVLINCGKNYGSYNFPDDDCEKLEIFTDKVMELSWNIYKKNKPELILN